MAELADALDSGSDPSALQTTRPQENSQTVREEQREKAQLPGQTEGVGSTSNAVEDALGFAIRKATEAGQWALVGQLATELEERRRARLHVVDLTSERAKRRP